MKHLLWLLALFGMGVSLSALAENPAQITAAEQQNTEYIGQQTDLIIIGVEGAPVDNVRAILNWDQLDRSRPLEGRRLTRFIKEVKDDARSALEPYGFYKSSVTIRRDALPDRFIIQVEPGAPLLVTEVYIDVESENEIIENWVQRFPIKAGDRLIQPLYENQKSSLISEALDNGYFDTRFNESTIRVDPIENTAIVVLDVYGGQQYSIGDIEYEWDFSDIEDNKVRQGLKQELIDSYVSFSSDTPFSSLELAKSQRALTASPYFATARITSGTRDEEAKQVPIKVLLTPSKRRAYNFEIGFGTDTGVRGGVGYENRRINRSGHSLNIRLGGSDIEKSAALNYGVPLTSGRKDHLNIFASYKEENNDSRIYHNSKLGVELVREWKESVLTVGVTAIDESFDVLNIDTGLFDPADAELLLPGLKWHHSEADDPSFPSKGWSATAEIRGASKAALSDFDLAQAIFEGKALHPFSSGSLRWRLKAASTLIESNFALPSSLGFLAGGDESIRGYAYESIGLQSDNSNNVGVAKNLTVASVEYQHPLKDGFALATFFDVGDAYDSHFDAKRGVGVGLRWRLPFGALKLDAASALDKDGTPIRVHFSFGTAL